jgi:hypothetical protein
VGSLYTARAREPPPPPPRSGRWGTFFWWWPVVGGAYTQQGRAHSRRLHVPMGPRAHAVESKAVVRIEVAVSPRPCLGCAVELALRVAPLRRGVPPTPVVRSAGGRVARHAVQGGAGQLGKLEIKS